MPHEDEFAKLEKSLADARASGDKAAEADTLYKLGEAYYFARNTERARECHEAALAIARELGDKRREADNLVALGSTTTWKYGYKHTIASCEQALALVREIGDRKREIKYFEYMGWLTQRNESAYTRLGRQGDKDLALVRSDPNEKLPRSSDRMKVFFPDYTQVLDYYQKALAVASEIEASYEQVSLLQKIAKIHSEQGDINQALGLLEQALSFLHNTKREDDLISMSCTICFDMGKVHGELKNFQQAIHCFEQALTFVDDDSLMKETCLGALGRTYEKQGNLKIALFYYEQRLHAGQANTATEAMLKFYREAVTRLCQKLDAQDRDET